MNLEQVINNKQLEALRGKDFERQLQKEINELQKTDNGEKEVLKPDIPFIEKTSRLALFEQNRVLEKKRLENSEYPSSYEERLNKTPAEGDRGHWDGGRGESKYIPSDEEIKEILAKYGLDGIEYRGGIPDFSKVSESTVEIDNMTENRYGKGGNFEQCDQKCAEQWNKDGRDGKTDWTARDVANWRRENGYSWHERNDRKTCDLVPTKINDYFGHFGGVGECKKANPKEGGFDE